MSSNRFYTFYHESGKVLINLATAALVVVFVTPFFGDDTIIFGDGSWSFDANAAMKSIIAAFILLSGLFLKTISTNKKL